MDAHKGYNGLSERSIHEFADYAVRYAIGAGHTNGLETLLPPQAYVQGQHVAAEPFHLTKYIDEQAYCYNTRELSDYQRCLVALNVATGSRLTCDDLTSAYADYFE